MLASVFGAMPGSCVTIQVGQCGNQLGACVLDRLAREFASEAEADYFFRAPLRGSQPYKVARAVLVDTEPRALGAARACSAAPRAAGPPCIGTAARVTCKVT